MSDYTLEEMQALHGDLIGLVREKKPTLAPDVMHLPVSDYTDRERWEREVEMIRSVPMVLAFSTELAEPGSYWAMTRVGVPLLLTRQKDGQIRLFINACRHRAAKVVHEGKGKAARLTCIYHAWTYGLDGKLLAIAEKDIFGDVDKSCLGLAELACEERAGLIWAILTPGVELDLDGFLGSEMDTMIRKSRFDRFHVVNIREVPAANWKLASEGYGETYHFPSVHGKTFISFIYPNILKFDAYGPHFRLLSPVVGIEDCDTSSLTELQRYVQISLTLFPHIMFAFASDTAFTDHDDPNRRLIERIFCNQVLPGDSPDRSITISRTLASEDIRGTDREAELENWSVSTHNVVRDEDYPTVQTTQDTLRSGAQESIVLGRNEIALQHFHRSIHEYVEKGTEGAAGKKLAA